MSGNRTPAVSHPAASSLKRKPPQHPDLTHRKRRRVDAQNARVISAQTTGKAFGDGQVDVDKFVRARQFEIKALEDAMKRSKKALSTRAFQNVPKDLRRRTASHDAKRVPKRLRSKAVREMIEDNTPTGKARHRKPNPHNRLRLDTVKRLKALHKEPGSTKKARPPPEDLSMQPTDEGREGKAAASDPKTPTIRGRLPRVKKNKLAKPATPKAKFRKRQIHKAWLPTHLFHAKRAHMTSPKEPLWRMAIPLSPTAKSYRSTHRASTAKGAVAWDMSYMSTVSLEGVQGGILEILKSLGVGRDESAHFWSWEANRWTDGIRSWDGWLQEPGSPPTASIAPVNIFWVAPEPTSTSQSKVAKRKAIIRVHPSAFLQLWEALLPLAKAQRPPVAVEDLRFEIGSIEVIGPASTEALVGILRQSPIDADAVNTRDDTTEFWKYLGAVSDPASLPSNSIINMDISDPRLHHRSRRDTGAVDAKSHQRLLNILFAWPPDDGQSMPKLFDRSQRLKACRQLPSQKAINRRKSLVGPNALPDPIPSDPSIPVTLLITKPYGPSRGTWTLLLPWKCVLPVWYSLMYYPLSSGGTVKFGGLDQKRQIGLESGTPWFPADFPATKAGMIWEDRERARRKADWEKRSKGKRVEWTSLDLGHNRKGEIGLGWACDWEMLTQADKSEGADAQQCLHRIPQSMAKSKLRSSANDAATSHELLGLLTVKVEMVGRGTPTTCARIYRLPSTNEVAREKWVALLDRRASGSGDGVAVKPLGFGQTKDAPPHVRRQHLAASLLGPETTSGPGANEHPAVPEEQDLVGFVTTGNFNLREGKGVGVGSILLSKILAGAQGVSQERLRKERHLCIVREAGQPTGRLARWFVVG